MSRFILLFSVLWPATTYAAMPGTGKRHVTMDYPLALQKAGVKQVHCVFKDSRGFLWVGAENGLYRFDGTNADLMEHEPGNRNTLPDNDIVSLAEDKAGNIWAGTLQGAARINAWTLQCAAYTKSLHNTDEEFDLKIYCGADGKIWLGSGSGLSIFDKPANRFRLVWHDHISGESNAGYINSLTDWKKDTLVAGTFHGLVLINKKDFGFRRVNPGPVALTITRVYVDDKKRIWTGTWGNGLMVSDIGCRSFVTLKFEKTQNRILQNVVTSIVRTNYNKISRLWVSTSDGVYELLGFKEDPAHCKAVPLNINAVGFINGLTADDEQYIWVSAASAARFYAGGTFFKPLPVNTDGIAQRIQYITVAGKKALAISSWYKRSGLLIADTSGQVIYRQPDTGNQDASNISGLAQDKYGRFWISSLGGINVLDPQFRQLPGKIFTGADQPSSTKTAGILINHDTVWLACYRHGINLYDLKFHKLRSFIPGDGSGITDNLFNGFFADRSGTVWLFGDYKLYRYNSPRGNFTVFNFNNEDTQFNVTDMVQKPDGDLLVASSTGLYDFNPVTGIYKRISSPLLSRERQVQSVCLDGHNDIWFSNNDRLVYYQVKTKHFTLFGKEDGLDNHDEPELLATRGGKTIYLVAGNDLIAFSPQRTGNEAPAPKLYLHALQVNDSTVSRPDISKGLRLNYDENKLNLQFGAINYTKPSQNLYAYQLSKVDKRWVTTTDNFASYANLAPGSYTFAVKAENYAGRWSDAMKLNIVITPPFWAAWWFRLLAGAMLFGAVFLVIRYIAQRNLREKILILEKEKAVEQERNRIARDMHDDLGSGLTKIAVMSEVTKAQLTNSKSATEYLDMISTSSRELVDNLQGIIWVLNPKNDSVESLVLYLKEYTESFFEHTPITLAFNYADDFGHLSLSEEKRRNIFLVVKEGSNNILKHAGATNVGISIKVKDHLLVVEIADDGRGFETGQVAMFSNGLQNMKNRIGQIGGVFELISSPGQGTHINCHIPV